MRIAGHTLIASVLLVATAAAADQFSGWELIGEHSVGRGADSTTLNARPIVYANRLRLCVDRSAIRFEDVEVLYRNGSRQLVPIGRDVPEGACTRDYELSSTGRRDIDRVVLNFAPADRDADRARIFVFAYGMAIGR